MLASLRKDQGCCVCGGITSLPGSHQLISGNLRLSKLDHHHHILEDNAKGPEGDKLCLLCIQMPKEVSNPNWLFDLNDASLHWIPLGFKSIVFHRHNTAFH